jgi:hypothetical protein
MLLKLLLVLIYSCSADQIIISSPQNNQTLTTNVINIDYHIQRNGMLYVLNSTATLINVTDNNILFEKQSVLPYDNFTFSSIDINNNYILKIVSYGQFLIISNGSHGHMNIEEFINFRVKLSHKMLR